jgi:hypothetical protein
MLLAVDQPLAAVTIEGASVEEGPALDAGIESIDMAEYAGSADPKTADRVRYLQLKHSTRHSDEDWTLSGLSKTLTDFAARYSQLVSTFGDEDVARRFSFEFTTNRPFASSLTDALANLQAGCDDARAKRWTKITGLTGAELEQFARLLTLNGGVGDFLKQRALLEDGLGAYLPDADRDAPLQLKELVARRATTEFERNPNISKMDVLEALGVDERDLFPAPKLIEPPTQVVEREQLASLARAIKERPGATVVRADAGVGKSVLSTQLGHRLPKGSRTFVYDCFGNGAYRSASGYRHRCRDGLVQLANEMAGDALCLPLIPTPKADDAGFVRVFMTRVAAAAAALEAGTDGALLCFVIDAADNAETAAQEAAGGPSFPRLLLREEWPANVRLVLTARPHRVESLRPDPSTPVLELEPFSEAETRGHAIALFGAATDADVAEFHRQSSRNPRVQATAAAEGKTLGATLRLLAGEPQTVEKLIGRLLEDAVARVRFEAPEVEQPQIDRVCAALATLRPFVPLDVVAKTAGVPLDLVRSLAHELHRPLIVRDDAVQFRDEPTETWFRERFRPGKAALSGFVDSLLPLAAESAYVAATLPQLMLEAGQFDELVLLALSGGALPTELTIARRDVELQRLQFALKAAIRSGRLLDAANLALKAGGETAADARQQKLLSGNTDLGARFLEPEQMLEQVSRRLIASGDWTGSDHAYEAAFLSGSPGLSGEARSRLRVSYDWLGQWARNVQDRGTRTRVTPDDAAEMSMAELNLHGADACATQLRRWRRRVMSFEAGRRIVSRLVDAGRFDDVDALAIAAGNDLGLLLAITGELAKVGRFPLREPLRRATRLVTSRHVTVEAPGDYSGDSVRLRAVVDLVKAAAAMRVAPQPALARTLTRYLPAKPPVTLGGRVASFEGRRSALLDAYCLRAALRRRTVSVRDVTPPEYIAPRERRKRQDWTRSGEAHRFREEVGALLPWHSLAAEVALGRVPAARLGTKIAAADQASRAAGRSYSEGLDTDDEVARLWGALALKDAGSASWTAFRAWSVKSKRRVYIPALLSLARRAGRTPGREAEALEVAKVAFDIATSERDDAESISDTGVQACRAVLLASPDEARAYFDQAVEISGRLGEECLDRLGALLNLADAAGRDGVDRPELAYRFSAAAELTHAYMGDKHFDWKHVVETLAALSSPSGPTVLSRWMDRRFGWESETLGYTVEALTRRGALDPRDALAMLPLDGGWSADRILARALDVSGTTEERRRAADLALRRARLSPPSASEWKRMADTLSSHGLDAKEALGRWRQETRAERDRERSSSSHRNTGRRRRETNAANSERAFEGLDPSSPQDLAAALAKFRAGAEYFDRGEFYRAAVALVRPGREAAFIAAVDPDGTLDLYSARELVRQIPAEWSGRLSARTALAALLRRICRRDCDSMAVDRFYRPLPWREVEVLTGLTMPDLVAESVRAIGETSIPDGYSALFRIAGMLSTMLDAPQAAEALDYGVGLLEPAMQPEDADGPWRTELAPPATTVEAIAGYVWAALASPFAERRWRAAHAVRAICRLDRRELLDALIALARTGSPGPFASPRHRFYGLHARLWLVIALARAADESGPAVARHIDLLVGLATRDNHHVMIREFAARGLLSLHGQGLIALAPSRVDELKRINQPKLAVKPERARRKGASKKPAYSDDKFLFGYDFEPYWLAPLARRFDTTDGEVAERGRRVIKDEWGLADNGHWDSDSRAVAGQFRDDDSYRNQGSYPVSDNLAFYLSLHSIYHVAGQLLDERAPVQRPDEDDAVEEWFDRHRLTRRDGLWLSDRRDPLPEDLGTSLDATRPGGGMLSGLFDRRDGTVVAFADWMAYRGSTRQQVDVSGVLVSAGRSQSLAVALGSATNPNDYRLPTSDGDHDEVAKDGWTIRGWMNVDEGEVRLDRQDPFASGLTARVPAPSGKIARLLDLAADEGERRWSDMRGVRMRAETWSDGKDDERTRGRGNGRRLLATRAILDRLMEATGTHMLFEVRIRRDGAPTSYGRRVRDGSKDDIEETRIVLLRPGEPPWTAPRGSGARRGHRRGARA